MKRLLLGLTTALALMSAPASASDIQIAGIGLPDSVAFNAATINGYSYYVGPVELTTSTGDSFLAFCADLNHTLQNGAFYNYGLLTKNGQGEDISATLSDKIRQITLLGINAQNNGNGFFASAIQLAIWSLEYNLQPTAYATTTVHDYFNDIMGMSFTDQHTLARVLIPEGNWPVNLGLSQQMIVAAQAVPGPIVGAGLPGLVTACLTLLGLGRWRRRQEVA